jgi:hypothetical protein
MIHGKFANRMTTEETMLTKIAAWGKRPFQFTLYTCIQFIILTSIAMLTYPGGTHNDPSTRGYSFTHNFFSSLGLTLAPNGEPNTISAVLFFAALAAVGFGLALFFLVSPQFFWQKSSTRMLSLAGSLFGVISGLSYVGIAFTPANIFPDLHLEFVMLAFRTFLVVVVFYTLAIYLNKGYPNRYAAIYLVFAILLAGYIYLMTQGPETSSVQGEMIQVVGQKVISYAAIIIMSIQSYGAMKMVESHEEGSPPGEGL